MNVVWCDLRKSSGAGVHTTQLMALRDEMHCLRNAMVHRGVYLWTLDVVLSCARHPCSEDHQSKNERGGEGEL